MVWAHSANEEGNRHLLGDHLHVTAQEARGFSSALDAGQLAYYVGLRSVARRGPAGVTLNQLC